MLRNRIPHSSTRWFDSAGCFATLMLGLALISVVGPLPAAVTNAQLRRRHTIYLRSSQTQVANAPYPPSTLIEGVTFSDLVIDGVTSGDQWAATWADDGHIYSTWGDGTGFGYRGGWDDCWTTYLGVARVKGNPPNHKGCNVWGGYEPESNDLALYRNRELNENLKPNSSIVSVNGVLYLYAVRERAGAHGQWSVSRLLTSKDHGRTWNDHGVLFDEPKGRFANVFAIQYGKDYAGTPSYQGDYVYLYGMENKEPTANQDILLARCEKDRLLQREAYEFFSGAVDNPSWSTDLSKARSIFHTDDGVSWWVSCVYDAALERYLLLTTHPPFGGQFRDHKGFGIFEAQWPWGPWKTILYTKSVGNIIQGMTEGISFTIPSKWIQEQGKTLWMVFAGRPSDPYYSFNLMKLRLNLAPPR
jgi:hypothetical protein